MQDWRGRQTLEYAVATQGGRARRDGGGGLHVRVLHAAEQQVDEEVHGSDVEQHEEAGGRVPPQQRHRLRCQPVDRAAERLRVRAQSVNQ